MFEHNNSRQPPAGFPSAGNTGNPLQRQLEWWPTAIPFSRNRLDLLDEPWPTSRLAMHRPSHAADTSPLSLDDMRTSSSSPAAGLLARPLAQMWESRQSGIPSLPSPAPPPVRQLPRRQPAPLPEQYITALHWTQPPDWPWSLDSLSTPSRRAVCNANALRSPVPAAESSTASPGTHTSVFTLSPILPPVSARASAPAHLALATAPVSASGSVPIQAPVPASVPASIPAPVSDPIPASDTYLAPTPTRSAVAADAASADASRAASPPVPILPPAPGYEFELNHEANLRELARQKDWAQAQLSSCNENNRFHTTQTTACIVAVNGTMVGAYDPQSLCFYGTRAEIPGLRVTLTVVGSGSSLSSLSGSSRHADDFSEPVLLLRHQIVIKARETRNNGRLSQSSPAVNRPRPRLPLAMSISHPTQGHPPNTPSNDPSNGLSNGTLNSTAAAAPRASPSSTRRFHFATTTIPLRGGVPTRPGYRPIDADAAVARMRTWGGQPERGVFGNAWLIHLTVEPGHAAHAVDDQALAQLERMCCPGATAVQAAAAQTAQAVNTHMAQLARQESTVSILLSNHGTQKRFARQCPDLVAMWVLAQENL